MTYKEILSFALIGIEGRRFSILNRIYDNSIKITPEKLRAHANELQQIEAKYNEVKELLQNIEALDE